MTRAAFRQRPLRYQLLPIVTLVFAGLWAGAAWWQARRVESVNAARLFGMAFGGAAAQELEIEAANTAPGTGEPSEAAPTGPVRSPLFPGLQLGPPRPTPEEERAVRRLQERIAYTEVVVLVWRRAMYAVASILALTGILGLLTLYVRGPHLAAATIMVAAMVATLVGMRLLQSPDGGGLPRLSIWSHVIVSVGMSAYPVALILLLARKLKAAPTKGTA